MNKVLLLGYISQDPKGKDFPEKNLSLSKFSIASNDMRNYNQTFFFNCVAWNQTAEYVNNNLKKGDYVLIDGRLTNRSYINEAGSKVYITEIMVDTIKNLGSKSKVNSSENLVDVDSLIKNNDGNNLMTETFAPNQQINDSKNDNPIEDVDWDDLD